MWAWCFSASAKGILFCEWEVTMNNSSLSTPGSRWSVAFVAWKKHDIHFNKQLAGVDKSIKNISGECCHNFILYKNNFQIYTEVYIYITYQHLHCILVYFIFAYLCLFIVKTDLQESKAEEPHFLDLKIKDANIIYYHYYFKAHRQAAIDISLPCAKGGIRGLLVLLLQC